ncbi:MAG: membrane-bound lytic murein transglycosylase MltF [Deltaproteobacteria bacterium]|nr:membrane-bound lytic murein transglycosylase MltF [Deltaproteobacteria bacterium]MBW2051282.1 membrane-bound lytic murein transglycosylase MltF [Deltaproteobacteria bacterium]MBW2140441.1 membrane-bound lytic murein transglycosylase MltF [Deltaproteobacteria bacterium]MBW2323228.1 membrane-bound lytic murein transglycosylase MltF [Deltaproteobacteria bacterium]
MQVHQSNVIKKIIKNTYFLNFILTFILVSLVAVLIYGRKDALWRIRSAGEIVVLTRNNAHCYYTYRGNPMGFEYDLAKAFSEYLRVNLKVMTPSWKRLTYAFKMGSGDFVAASLTITESRKKLMAFSDEYLAIQQQVIIHARNNRIKSIESLEGKTVHVRRGTSYEERLKELKEEGLGLEVKLYEDMPTEELIRMVAEKEIEVTVADSNIALLNRHYYPDIKAAFPIAKPQSLGWAVRKGEKKLLKEINLFFQKIKEDGTLNKIYERYYEHKATFDYVDLKRFHHRLKTRLPRYKNIIKSAAEKNDFDWRLITAMVYQESHFHPRATSFTGVKGLMQLTQKTAREMGITNRLDPKQSIDGGVKYLKKLYKRYNEAEPPDRLLIALASYNVGHGHIQDAQEIAKQKNIDPNDWKVLEQILPLLRYPKYYKKSKYGYCRGTEPVRYVNKILMYYDILKMEAVASGSGA